MLNNKYYEIHYYDYATNIDSLIEKDFRNETTYGIDKFDFAVIRKTGEDYQGNEIWESDDKNLYGIKTEENGYFYVVFIEDEKITEKAYYFYDKKADKIVSETENMELLGGRIKTKKLKSRGNSKPLRKGLKKMTVDVNIKNTGKKFGTVGWLKESLKNKNLILEESNDFYIPPWGNEDTAPATKTHGLIINDGKNEALLAYRLFSGKYEYSIEYPLGGYGACFAHWNLCLTDAAKDVLAEICEKWIALQEKDNPLDGGEITITIK